MYKDTAQSQDETPTSKAPNSTISGVTSVEDTASITVTSKTSKVNSICDRFLTHLTTGSKPTAKTLRNIITAHVCKQPPDLEAGLFVIATLQSSQSGSESELVERAAEHICFLADVNTLYSTSLGLYNIDLALLIAQQSQKDPREYLPYLQSLQSLPDIRRRFTIDNDLGRHTKALKHLQSLGLDEFEELKRYVQKHELYNQAIDLYRYQDEQMHSLTKLYADFLCTRNRFAEAGLAYDFLGDYASASESYRQAGLWREALSSVMLAPSPTSDDIEVQALARDLAASCEETKDFSSAALIHSDYLDDAEAAVRLYCKAHEIPEALRLVGRARRPEWLESVVDPGLVEGVASLSEMLGEMREQLRNQVPRLRELRQKKMDDPLAFYDGGLGGAVGDGVDIPDNISLAPTDATTSGGTFMTRYTGRSAGTINTQTSRRTSKNRRREERKRARGKKGTVYEEEYLVNSIARLIDRVNAISPDAIKLVEGLLRRRMRERALNLERLTSEVVEACRMVVSEVFQVDEKKEASEGVSELGERPLGPDGVVWDSLESMGKKIEPPVVKEFKRLSVLGS